MRDYLKMNRERINFKQFWKTCVLGGWRFKFHRRLCTDKNDPLHNRFVNLWVDETAGHAWGFAEPRQNEPGPVPRDLWFFYECKHENTNRENLGRCWNRYTCKDCGHAVEIDSSD